MAAVVAGGVVAAVTGAGGAVSGGTVGVAIGLWTATGDDAGRTATVGGVTAAGGVVAAAVVGFEGVTATCEAPPATRLRSVMFRLISARRAASA